jgi:hypothetical protein
MSSSLAAPLEEPDGSSRRAASNAEVSTIVPAAGKTKEFGASDCARYEHMFEYGHAVG